MTNIVLFGFMGCGKSTVGALLAQKSGRPLLDTDGYLEQKYGRTIPQIFATDGEEAFRQMERQVCRELAGRTGLVLCCGGGTVLNGENADLLAQSGTMVFLDAPFMVCYDRIRESDRPLVQKNSKEEVQRIFEFRRPIYLSRAQVTADAASSPIQVADAILAAVRHKGAGR